MDVSPAGDALAFALDFGLDLRLDEVTTNACDPEAAAVDSRPSVVPGLSNSATALVLAED